jgi:hypothetical protein
MQLLYKANIAAATPPNRAMEPATARGAALVGTVVDELEVLEAVTLVVLVRVVAPAAVVVDELPEPV